MKIPYISTSFLTGYSRLVCARGGDPAALYASVGLSEANFTHENLLIPFAQFVYLLENTADQLNFPDIALQMARQQDIMVLAPLGPMLNRCRDLSEALGVIIKYLRFLVSGYQVDIQVRNEHMQVSFHCEIPQIKQLVQFQDYALASAVTILNELLGHTHPIRGCYFLRDEQDAARARQYASYFGCPVAFAANQLSITVDSRILKQDIEPIVSKLANRIHDSVQFQSRDWINQVAKVLSYTLTNNTCNIRDVAAAMGYSQRTLQRKLQEQGTSFRALLDSVRFTLANHYLTESQYRLTDIALLLGYSNQSAFTRSYHRWSGVYPMEVRQQVARASG